MEQPVVTVLGRHRHRPRVLLIAIAPLLLALFAVTFSISPLNGEDYGLSRLDLGQPLLDRLSWITQKSAYNGYTGTRGSESSYPFFGSQCRSLLSMRQIAL